MVKVPPPKPPPPPRPGAGGGPAAPGGMIAGPRTGPRINSSRGTAPSDRSVLIVILLNLGLASLVVVLTPWPHPAPAPDTRIWVGFVCGLFGCTIVFGLMQLLVQRQHEAGAFSDWNIPVSKVTIARIATTIGWAAGAVNCYVLAHNVASALA